MRLVSLGLPRESGSPLARIGASLLSVAAVTFPATSILLDGSPAGASTTTPTAYVVNFSGDSVTPIDITSNTPGTPITGGK